MSERKYNKRETIKVKADFTLDIEVRVGEICISAVNTIFIC